MTWRKNNKKAVRNPPMPECIQTFRRLNVRSRTRRAMPRSAPGSRVHRTSCNPDSWTYEKTKDRQAVIPRHVKPIRAAPPALIFKGSPSKSLAFEMRRNDFLFLLKLSVNIVQKPSAKWLFSLRTKYDQNNLIYSYGDFSPSSEQKNPSRLPGNQNKKTIYIFF